MLSDDFLYQLRQSCPIESVMSSYTNLRKRGRNYTCLCPFHSEKTPSCTVYPETSSFYCFGCGAGGDVITFIRRIENLDYIEAVRFLAEKAGITVPEDGIDNKAALIKSRVLEANRTAARFFHATLRSRNGEKGVRYFRQRELSNETIIKYGLGYAPNDMNSFTSYMKKEGFSDEELIAAYLCKRSQRGNIYPVFIDRVMFPIIDLRGNVIAFGGRRLDGDGPKYLNSGDTPVFKKSRNLFSLNFAKADKSKRLILAEGYMDVIAINQAGFENVVATLGTALTPEQARLMSQYANEVIIAYDSDDAGQTATHKAINLLSEVGVTTKIIRMDGAKDPDEYIKKNSPERFKLLLDNSSGAIAFELEKAKRGLDLANEADRVTYLKRTLSVLADISSPIERDVYISRIADDQNISADVLRSQVAGILRGREKSEKKLEWTGVTTASFRRDEINPDARKFQKENKAEQGILAYLFSNPDKLDEIMKKVPPEKFLTSFNKKVYQSMAEKIKNSMNFSISSLSDEFSVDEMGKISETIVKYRDITLTSEVIDDYINVLLNYKESSPAGEISDEEFLRFAQNLKQK